MFVEKGEGSYSPNGTDIEVATSAAEEVIQRLESSLGDAASPLSQVLSVDEALGKPARSLIADIHSVASVAVIERELITGLAEAKNARIPHLEGIIGEERAKLAEAQDAAKTAAERVAELEAVVEGMEVDVRKVAKVPKDRKVLDHLSVLVSSQERLAEEKRSDHRRLKELEAKMAELEAASSLPEGAVVFLAEDVEGLRALAGKFGGVGGKALSGMGATKMAAHIDAWVEKLRKELEEAKAATPEPTADQEALIADLRNQRHALRLELGAMKARLEAFEVPVARALKLVKNAGMTYSDGSWAIRMAEKVGVLGEDEKKGSLGIVESFKPVAVLYATHAKGSKAMMVCSRIEVDEEAETLTLVQYVEPGASPVRVTLAPQAGGEIYDVQGNLGVPEIAPFETTTAKASEVAAATATLARFYGGSAVLTRKARTLRGEVNGAKMEQVLPAGSVMLTLLGRRQRAKAEAAARAIFS